MKRNAQSGFAVVELIVVVVVVAAIAGVGYFVMHKHSDSKTSSKASTSKTATSSQTQSASTDTAAVPEVNKASDLNNAMQTLDQTNVASGSADSSQLDTQASNF